jgi:hypothetical protein
MVGRWCFCRMQLLIELVSMLCAGYLLLLLLFMFCWCISVACVFRGTYPATFLYSSCMKATVLLWESAVPPPLHLERCWGPIYLPRCRSKYLYLHTAVMLDAAAIPGCVCLQSTWRFCREPGLLVLVCKGHQQTAFGFTSSCCCVYRALLHCIIKYKPLWWCDVGSVHVYLHARFACK